jgi:2-polyprenyl-3-methyl-5-hydroxy-6-metoxy-1,4-benzoquinol methylase
MGPAEGLSTRYLAEAISDLTVVDGSQFYVDSIRRQIPRVKAEFALFEEYEPKEYFHNIIMGHVLEHVQDPIAVVEKARSWLLPRGRIIAAVPNAHSLHRQVGVLAGLLKTETQLNESDVSIGHRRVFTNNELQNCFSHEHFTHIYSGGYYLKTVSNLQISMTTDSLVQNSLMRLGERYPDIAADIYIVVEKRE